MLPRPQSYRLWSAGRPRTEQPLQELSASQGMEKRTVGHLTPTLRAWPRENRPNAQLRMNADRGGDCLRRHRGPPSAHQQEPGSASPGASGYLTEPRQMGCCRKSPEKERWNQVPGNKTNSDRPLFVLSVTGCVYWDSSIFQIVPFTLSLLLGPLHLLRPGCPVLSSGLGISMRALPPVLGLRSHASRRPQPGPRSCSLGHPSRPRPCHSAPSLLFPPTDDFTHGLTNLLADGASPPTVPHLLSPLPTPGTESYPSRPGGTSALPRCLLQEGPTLRMWEASCASVPCRALTVLLRQNGGVESRVLSINLFIYQTQREWLLWAHPGHLRNTNADNKKATGRCSPSKKPMKK